MMPPLSRCWRDLSRYGERPGMYIGGTDIHGLHHLVYEIVDNSVDEAMQGFGNRINVTIGADDSVSVRDFARGIPTDIHAKMKISALEVVMTTLHAGGKFDSGAYVQSGGLHGVGASVVNALSEWCRVEVRQNGKVFVQEYERGKAKAPVKAIGKAEDTGTLTIFKADPTVFDTTRLRVRDPGAALPRDVLPQQRSHDHLQRRAPRQRRPR